MNKEILSIRELVFLGFALSLAALLLFIDGNAFKAGVIVVLASLLLREWRS